MAADVNTAFATAVGRLRVKRGWSQARLAEEAGISRSMLSLVELGKSSPNLAVAIALARALDGSLDEMAGLSRAGESGSKIRGGSDA